MNVLENKSAVLHVELMENNEYVELTSSDKAVYSLLDSAGNVVAGISDENYKIDSETTTLNISLPAEGNILPAGKQSDGRFLIITYTKDKKEHTIRYSYNVIKFVPYTVTESDVYALLGISNAYVSESAIDIYGAYLQLYEQVGEKLTTALTAGGTDSIKANRAILLKTAIGLQSAVLLGVPRVETDNIVSQTRYDMSKDVLDALFSDLKAELGGLLDELNGASSEFNVAAFIVPSITDPFTGE